MPKTSLNPLLQIKETFSFKGQVEIFPQQGGWYYVRVPQQYTKLTADLADRGLVAITATLGDTTWPTSLLPYGDGTHFIALNAKVRKAENINLGDHLSISFQLRER
jgi:hypothetical protein